MSNASYWAARLPANRYSTDDTAPKVALQKLVLLAYADCPGDPSCKYPSVAWLCEWSSLDRKTVMRATAALEAAGLLIDTEARRGHTKQIKVYRLGMETVPETGPLSDETVPDLGPLGGDTVPETGLFERGKSPVSPSKDSQKRDTEPPSEPPTPSKASPSSETRARKPAAAKPKFRPPAWVPLEAWDGWLEMRRANGKRPTDRALELAVVELAKLAEDGHPPGEVLDQSTKELWTGLWPIKEKRNDRGHGNALVDAAIARSRGRYRDPLLNVDPAVVGLAGDYAGLAGADAAVDVDFDPVGHPFD